MQQKGRKVVEKRSRKIMTVHVVGRTNQPFCREHTGGQLAVGSSDAKQQQAGMKTSENIAEDQSTEATIARKEIE